MTATPQLLMVHGLMGSIAYIEPQRYLPGILLHTPDMIGYGRKRDDTLDIGVPGQAAALVRLLRDEIKQPVWLLGHSVGGAVAMLVADAAPELVLGLISVEGNFTLKDAFWSSRIAALPDADWAYEYGTMEAAPAAWLERGGIEASDERVLWAREILGNQPYTTVQRMAQSVVAVTGAPAYLELVRRVFGRTPVYLVGGELSAAGWDVPEWALASARRIELQPRSGHMMMLEDPAAFCGIIAGIVAGIVEDDFINEAKRHNE